MRSSFGKVFMGAAGGEVLPSDDKFNHVSFLSHFDGANEGKNNVFIDGHDTSSPHTITANGNVTQGSFGPFARPEGEWGWSFDASAEGLVLDYGSTSHNYWNSNFTFEFWVNNGDTGSINTLFGCWQNNQMANGSYNLGFDADGKIELLNRQSSGANSGPFVKGATATNDGNWHHIAITQIDDGGDTKYFRIFVDGVLDAYDTETSWTQGTSGQEITIGGLSIVASSYESARRYTGVISNWRIVESIVYSTASTTIGATIFTPPTGPLTAISNTRILSCQSNRFVDNSSNGYALNSHGNGKVTAFGPFLTSQIYSAATNGASAYFDGTGDYLDADDGVTFGTGAFTIECFVYLNKGTQQFFFDARPDGVNTTYPAIYVPSNLKPVYYANSGVKITGLKALRENAWHHIAVCRSGTSTKLFLDGTQAGSTYSDSTNYADSGRMRVGANKNESSRVEGYISDVRVVHSALYTSNFTPPTAPLTKIADTNLLLNMANGQAIDSAAQNTLTLVGTAQLSTAQKKFGTASLLLDGNSDFASFPHFSSNDISGAGNWTVELFWRFVDNDATNIQEIVTKGSGFQLYARDGALAIALSANNNTSYFLSNTGGTTLSDNTWYHIAVVKNGTAYNVYLNGTNEADLDGTSSSNASTGTDPWNLGAYTSNSYFANGYMDEFRISKFARYTANFTAPAEPFADKGQ